MDNIAPHSVEAEEGVLGSVLLNPALLPEIDTLLSADDFYVIRHRWVWEAISALRRRLDPIDYTTVVAELSGAGRLDEIGGAAYILNLINATPTALHAEGYAHIVSRHATRRRLLAAASSIAKLAYDTESELADALAQAEAEILAVSKQAYSEAEQIDLYDLAWAEVERAQAYAAEPGKVRGMSLWPPIDRRLGGIDMDIYAVLCARPEMGKSTLMRQMIAHILQGGGQVFYFSIEDSASVVVSAMACGMAHVSSTKLKAGTLTAEELQRYETALNKIALFDALHLYTGAITADEIRRIVQRERTHEQAIVMVDTLNRLPMRRVSDQYEKTTANSETLGNMAAGLNIPVIAIAQLNRGLFGRTDKRPRLDDLRDSGAIEEHARLVLGLHRPGYYDIDADQELAELIVLKRNFGGIGGGHQGVKMVWRPEIPAFFEVAHDDNGRKQATGRLWYEDK